MPFSIFSNSLPRNRWLLGLLLVIVLGLFFVPMVAPGAKAMNVATKIIIFILLAASFDLLLGYTGILSFAHTMFYGIGAYGIAIASTHQGGNWSGLIIGALLSLLLAAVLAVLISLFSLRVRTLYYAMITLAVAAAFQVFCSTFPEWTGGDDGINFSIPELLQPSTVFAEQWLRGAFTGQTLLYYLLLATTFAVFALLLRLVNSPFGRVLQCVRDNDLRAQAIGYNPTAYRMLATIISALLACLAGMFSATWLKYTGPSVTLGFDVMMDVLFIVIIGGVGSLYGAIIGSAVYILAQNYLQDLLKLLEHWLSGVPVAESLVNHDRWLLWMGILFILCVRYFPLGVVGKLNAIAKEQQTV